jgi:regulator of RNase E activity RraA
VDNLILYQALDIAQAGDVLVIAADESTTTSVFGDHVCAIAKARGIAAMVTDGLVRDAAGIREVGLPVFARGINPNGPFKDGPGEVNFPIAIGGLPVNPGDLLVGDEDGVVVVRREDIPVVVKNLETVGKKEKQMSEDIAAGRHISTLIREALATKGIELIE